MKITSKPQWLELTCVLVLVGVAVFLGLRPAHAQGTGYDLSWNTVDGGGGLSSKGDYSLHGTAGQPDAGALANGEYTLSGGFWGGGAAVVVAVEHTVYLPLVLRN